jgi:hypothetical protein
MPYPYPVQSSPTTPPPTTTAPTTEQKEDEPKTMQEINKEKTHQVLKDAIKYLEDEA